MGVRFCRLPWPFGNMRPPGYRRGIGLAAYVILGINAEGRKTVLTVSIGKEQSSKYWLSVLNELKNRGRTFWAFARVTENRKRLQLRAFIKSILVQNRPKRDYFNFCVNSKNWYKIYSVVTSGQSRFSVSALVCIIQGILSLSMQLLKNPFTKHEVCIKPEEKNN